MNKQDIISFFDNLAGTWDKNQVVNHEIMNTIVENSGVSAGKSVLDVACGTGVMFPYYLDRGAVVTGIDISSEMVKLAREKFPDLSVLCGDVECYPFKEKFDAVVIHNAFPHFENPERLIENLTPLVKQGGTFSVAHSLSREALHKHHSECASSVSIPLLDENELANLLAKDFSLIVKISNNQMYQVTGIKR